MGKLTTLCFAGVVLVLACSVPTGSGSSAPPEGGAAPPASARGGELFARHCTLCHGPSGQGDGVVADHLSPPPVDFATGTFRLVSTDNGVPSDDDLRRTLRRGMPGSAMPSFGWMADDDLTALTRTVRGLAIAGMAARLQAEARAGGAELDAAAAAGIARARLTPGTVLDVGTAAHPTPAVLTRGRQLYRDQCARCHGEDGTGQPLHEAAAALIGGPPRDFTAGILAGGASHQALAWRVLAGMPGTAMAAHETAPADLGPLVAYVRSLLRPGAENRLVQEHRHIVARHLEGGAVPTDPRDERWAAVGDASFALAPLRWSHNAVLRARISAVHDGTTLAVRLQWQDPSRDDTIGAAPRADAAALQLSRATEPPLMGMGDEHHPTDIWHWQPVRPGDVAALLDLANQPHARLTDAMTGTPTGQTAHAAVAEGVESARRFRTEGTALHAEATWHDGTWSLVFTRSLTPRTETEVALVPGSTLQLSVAIWDGSTARFDADKSFSVWHALELAR